MPRRPVAHQPSEFSSKVVDAILNLIGDIPESNIKKSSNPVKDSRKLAQAAARKSFIYAGGLALPPGPMGWLTVLPELLSVWRIQAQLVADIAALHGKGSALTQEQMIYCLFRHAAAQVVRDLVVRIGGRTLVKRATLRMIRAVLGKVGVRVAQRTLGKSIARWLPFLGAAGVAGYAYYDTYHIGKTSIDLFGSTIELEGT